MNEQEFDSADEANAFLQNLLNSGEPLPSTARTPLQQAQDIMYDAWDTPSRSQRIKLAKRALSISEDCADAYLLLSEDAAKTPEEALKYCEKGVKAGERALGPEVFEEDVGHFWGILETRPYMRARAELAQYLWFMGERRQAIEHLTDMLRLNPNDNQGLRYVLINFLLEVGDNQAVEKLLGQYEDSYSATWFYSRALLLFRREGASRKATKRLKEATAYNRFVPPYLLGRKGLPRRMPDYISFGDETEAVDYVSSARIAWHQTDGALTWLRGVFDEGSAASAH
jgi:tetratricopeptide (TPR) repeat protein